MMISMKVILMIRRIRRRAFILLLLSLVMVGCLDLDALVETPPLTDDYVIPPDDAEVAERQQPLDDTQVIYVNFDGVTVADCPDETYCSDAPNNRSSIIDSFFGEESIAWEPYNHPSGRQVVMDELHDAFAPYDVQFTTDRPSSGPYTMLVVASNSEFDGLGVAPLDCDNRWATNIAFVYRADEFAPSQIANAAVHELGHSFGLAHVVHEHDYMYHLADDQQNQFTSSDYDIENAADQCTDGAVQDAPQMLLDNLGPSPFDGHFADDDGSVHEPAIDALYEEGITDGCNEGVRPKFCPDDLVTRGQMAAFLTRALDLPAATQNYFNDTDGAWFEDYANRMAEAEITEGCEAGKYCGNDDITRGQMAVFLARGFDLGSASQSYFDDTDGAYYEDAADRLAEAEITHGCSDRTYCGQDPVTRGQMASFLARALGLI